MVDESIKKTELGNIPISWSVCNIMNVVNSIKIGPFGSQLKKEYLVKNGKYRVYGQENVYRNDFSFGERYLTKEHYLKLKSCELSKGDFVISSMGTIGKCHVITENIMTGIMDSHLIRLRLNTNKIDSNYLLYLFGNDTTIILNQITKLSVGGIMDGLSTKIIKSLKIILPSLDEQQDIAKNLSDIDNLILSLEKLIEKKKAIKQGTMQELLAGKRRLDGFTDEWIDTTIGEICDVFDGTHQTPRYVDKGIPFYSVENITNNEFRNVKYISVEEHEFLTKSRHIEKGDILMTRIGSIGVCKYIDWDVNASYYVSLALIKCKKVDSKFLTAYSYTRNFQNEIELNSLPSATPKKINLGPISSIKIRMPKSEAEQKMLANIAFDLDSEIKKLESKLSKYRQIKQGMMQELLTGRIRLV